MSFRGYGAPIIMQNDLKGDIPICYWKGTAEEFTDPNPKYRWLTMKNDKAIGKVDEDHEAGLI